MLFSILLLLAGFFFWKYRYYGLAVFNLIWGFVWTICQGDVLNTITSKTQGILVLMILFVNIGYGCGVFWARHIKISNSFSRVEYIEEKKYCNYSFLKVLLIIAFVLFCYYSFRTISRYGFNLNAVRSGNNSDSESTVFNSLIDTILFYGFARPMIYVGSLVVAYNTYIKIKVPRDIIALLGANVLLFVLTSGGRTLVFRIVAFVCAMLIWKTHQQGKKAVNLKKVWMGAVILVVVMNIITSSRTLGSQTFLGQILAYFKGSIIHMDYQVRRINSFEGYFGYITYGGFLYYPVKIISGVLNNGWQTSNELLVFLQNQIMLKVGGLHFYYNALVPNAFYYYYDMSYLGVILFSFILGIATGKYELSYKKPTFIKFIMFSTAVYAIGYSVLGGVLWSFGYPTAIIYCFILKKKLYKHTKKYKFMVENHYE